MNYYNENDPSAAAWIMELMKAGAVPDGHLDTRSIVDVQPEDLRGFDQCHFFGGILGWPLALQLSGYQNVKGLWTGSCPCQPFSAAGKRKGTADARHLWPEMFRLVKACKPKYCFGEQVEAAIRLGWLDGVFGDLEGEGYETGAVVLGAHSVGAPHIRQRLYWGGARRGVEFSTGEQVGIPGLSRESREPRGLGNTNIPRPQGHGIPGERPSQLSPWASSILIPCADGKTRRISPEPGVFPLAHGVPGHVGKLRGFGNAIVPQCAAEFITAFMETVSC